MESISYVAIASGVAVGNILSFGLIWSLFQMSKSEDRLEEPKMPHRLVAIVSLTFIAGGIYLAI